MTTEQKKEQKNRLLKAKIAVALNDELGRVPKQDEIEQVFLMARVMYKAILGLHYKRKEQKKNGQQPSSSTPLCSLATHEFQLTSRTLICSVMLCKRKAVSKSTLIGQAVPKQSGRDSQRLSAT